MHDWITDAVGNDVSCNRAVLGVRTPWGRIVEQEDYEDYEDSERAAAFDRYLENVTT